MKRNVLAATMIVALFAVSCGNGGNSKTSNTDSLAAVAAAAKADSIAAVAAAAKADSITAAAAAAAVVTEPVKAEPAKTATPVKK